MEPRYFDYINVDLPKLRILKRLGYNVHLTELHESQWSKVESAISDGFALCDPRGVYIRVPIISRSMDHVDLMGGHRIFSKSLAKLLEDSMEVLLLGVTVGEKLVTEIQKCFDTDDGVRAAIFDATGSETADLLLDWMQGYVARTLPREGRLLTKMRFSPGYGDLALDNQKILYNLLNLERLDVRLTERFILIPEKSVMGIVGIE